MTAFVIALDGPAAAGKSTVGLGVARRLGFRYVDTGLLYRALTWLVLRQSIDATDEAELERLVGELRVTVDPLGRVARDGQDITDSLHGPDVDTTISKVAAQPKVRRALVPVQRALVAPPGVVMTGRDIGTVIVPEAPLKVWLSASAEERARRRADQRGQDVQVVLEGMRQRDSLDGSRAVAPMARAADAVDINSDGLAPEQVIERIVELARARGASPAAAAVSPPEP